MLDFEVSGHTRGLSGNIDDAQIIQRALHFVELRGIEFLANIEQFRSRLALLVNGHRRWIPLRFADVVSDIGIVVRNELEGVLIGRQERVVAYAEGFDIVGAELEQIRFDPLFEVGAQRSGVDFSDVDHVFGGDSNKPLFGVLRILFTDDEVDERIPFGVAELNEHPDPFAPFGLLLLIGFENTEEFLVVPFLACDIEHLEADEKVRRFAHLLVGVGWVTFVRWDGPNAVAVVLGDLELSVLLRVGIVLENLQRGGFERIGELLKKDLVDPRRGVGFQGGEITSCRRPS